MKESNPRNPKNPSLNLKTRAVCKECICKKVWERAWGMYDEQQANKGLVWCPYAEPHAEPPRRIWINPVPVKDYCVYVPEMLLAQQDEIE